MDKRKIPLYIALSLPVLLILWILVFVYLLPSIAPKPEYDFLYITEKPYNSDVRVSNGKVIINDDCVELLSCDNQYRFYVYDSSEEESHYVRYEEVVSMKIDDSDKSEDGATVKRSHGGSGGVYFFPFYDSYSSGREYIIRKGLYYNSFNINGYYYYSDLVGWIIDDGK